MINSLLPSINLSPDALLAFVAFSQLPVASCQFRCSAIGNSHLFFLLSGTAHRERTEATAEERLDLTQESVGLKGTSPVRARPQRRYDLPVRAFPPTSVATPSPPATSPTRPGPTAPSGRGLPRSAPGRSTRNAEPLAQRLSRLKPELQRLESRLQRPGGWRRTNSEVITSPTRWPATKTAARTVADLSKGNCTGAAAARGLRVRLASVERVPDFAAGDRRAHSHVGRGVEPCDLGVDPGISQFDHRTAARQRNAEAQLADCAAVGYRFPLTVRQVS